MIDASLSLQWFLEDEADRGYSLSVLRRLAEFKPVVPLLWFYELGNGLTMACRRKPITYGQADGILSESVIFRSFPTLLIQPAFWLSQVPGDPL